MIKFEDVICRYESFEEDGPHVTALDGVNFVIERGSFTVIAGRNGSGKSTAAKCMNALMLPAEGRVLVSGMDTSDGSLTWQIRSMAGMVFQDPDNQIVSSEVEDDVAFGPENTGVPADEIRRRIDAAMEAVGISELRHKTPERLSGGQKQRVAIAGVLAMQPECIIFDESTAMLDPAGRAEINDIMRRLHENGTTIVAITHFMDEVARADRVIVLGEGKVMFDGTPPEVFSQPEIIAEAGLNLPPAVKIRNILRGRGIQIPDEVIDMESLADCIAELLGR